MNLCRLVGDLILWLKIIVNKLRDINSFVQKFQIGFSGTISSIAVIN